MSDTSYKNFVFGKEDRALFVNQAINIAAGIFDLNKGLPPMMILAVHKEYRNSLDERLEKEPVNAQEDSESIWGVTIIVFDNKMLAEENKPMLETSIVDAIHKTKAYAIAFVTEGWMVNVQDIRNKNQDEIAKKIMSGNMKVRELPDKIEVLQMTCEFATGERIMPIWKIIRPGNDPNADPLLIEFNDDVKMPLIKLESPSSEDVSIQGRFCGFYKKLELFNKAIKKAQEYSEDSSELENVLRKYGKDGKGLFDDL